MKEKPCCSAVVSVYHSAVCGRVLSLDRKYADDRSDTAGWHYFVGGVCYGRGGFFQSVCKQLSVYGRLCRGRASAQNMQVQAGAGAAPGERIAGRQTGVSAVERVSGQQAETAAGVRSVSMGRTGGVSSLIGARSIAAAGQVSGVAAVSAGRGADPESPVQPVDQVSAVQPGRSGSINYMIPFLRKGMDPAELSVRMRMQYAGGVQRSPWASGEGAAGAELPGTSRASGEDAVQMDLPGASQASGGEAVQLDLPETSRASGEEAVELELPGTSRVSGEEAVQLDLPGTASSEETAVQAGVPGTSSEAESTAAASEKDAPKVAGMGTESAQKTSGEAECKTCKERKYQDGSDDPGVSFKSPTHIAPDQSASAVRGHELEHVVRERAKAQSEGRRVISQSVTMQTGICPECGRVYTAGGVTRTTTAADSKPEEKPKDPRWILAGDI